MMNEYTFIIQLESEDSKSALEKVNRLDIQSISSFFLILENGRCVNLDSISEKDEEMIDTLEEIEETIGGLVFELRDMAFDS